MIGRRRDTMGSTIVGRLRSRAAPNESRLGRPAPIPWPGRLAGAMSWTVFVMVATAALVWVSWYTSASTDFPTKLALWFAVVGLITAAGACLRALIRHLGWAPVEQSAIEHAADGLAVVLGVILATALVGSTAGGGLLLTGIRSIPVAEALVPVTPRAGSPASAMAAALAAAAVAASANQGPASASTSLDQVAVSSVPLVAQAGPDPNRGSDQDVSPTPNGTDPASSAGSTKPGSSSAPPTTVAKASGAVVPGASSSLPATGSSAPGSTAPGSSAPGAISSVPVTTKPTVTIASSATSTPPASPTTIATRVTTPPATVPPGTSPPATSPPSPPPPPTTSGPPTTTPNTEPPPTTAPPPVATTSPPTIPTVPAELLPKARPDRATTSPGTDVTIKVLANDSGNLLSNTVRVVGGPIGAATVNGNGTITYSPVALAGNSDSFSYEVCDSAGRCASAEVRISIH